MVARGADKPYGIFTTSSLLYRSALPFSLPLVQLSHFLNSTTFIVSTVGSGDSLEFPGLIESHWRDDCSSGLMVTRSGSSTSILPFQLPFLLLSLFYSHFQMKQLFFLALICVLFALVHNLPTRDSPRFHHHHRRHLNTTRVSWSRRSFLFVRYSWRFLDKGAFMSLGSVLSYLRAPVSVIKKPQTSRTITLLRQGNR